MNQQTFYLLEDAPHGLKEITRLINVPQVDAEREARRLAAELKTRVIVVQVVYEAEP